MIAQLPPLSKRICTFSRKFAQDFCSRGKTSAIPERKSILWHCKDVQLVAIPWLRSGTPSGVNYLLYRDFRFFGFGL